MQPISGDHDQSETIQASALPVDEPQGVTFSVRPAGAWSRFWAGFIDSMILGLPAIAVTLLIEAIRGNRVSISSLENNSFYAILAVVLYFAYYVYLTAKKGATVGKDAYGLKVVYFGTDKNLTYVQSFLRELIKFGIILIPLVGSIIDIINGLVIIFSKDKRGIHDHVVNSQVLKVKPPWRMRKQILFFGGYIILGILLLLLWTAIKNLQGKYLPTPTVEVSTQKSQYETYTNSRDGWSIQYDSTKYKPPLRLSEEGEVNFGFPVVDYKLVSFTKKSGLVDFCIDQFSVTFEENKEEKSVQQWLSSRVLDQYEISNTTVGEIQGLILTNPNFYFETIDSISGRKTVSVHTRPSMLKAGLSEAQATRIARNVEYILPFSKKIFILEYGTGGSEDFPEQECANNELAIQQMFSTFRPF